MAEENKNLTVEAGSGLEGADANGDGHISAACEGHVPCS